MSNLRTLGHVRQMIESARLAISYVEGYGREDFIADRRTQQATVLNLLVIGELAGKVLADDAVFAAEYVHVPWRSMVGMRNRIAHGYFEIDLDVVWQTVETSLPNLLESLDSIPGSSTES